MPRSSTLTLPGLLSLAAACLFSFALLAQWPQKLPPSAPTLPDGSLNLNAPAPKLADGHPDFSGLWAAESVGGGPAGKGPAGKGKDKGPVVNADGIPRGGFQNLGINFPGGLLPYTPAGAALRNARLADNSKDHPDAHCLPLNAVQLWFHPQPRKLIQTAGEILFLAEANEGVRQLFLDGRPLPDPKQVQPWWYGYSVGKWEGDTLVVESVGYLDDTWIDEQGSPMSDQGRITERIRRPNYGTLEIQVTVNDSKYYTRPFTVTANQRLMPGEELIEFVCGENNTNLPHLVGKGQ